jgi:hypothetical protein
MDSEEFDVTVEEGAGEEGVEVIEEGGEVIEDSSSSEEECEGLVTLSRKRKEPSPVWECGAIKIEGGTKCTLCGKEYKCSSGNTSNVTRHILKNHQKQSEGKKLKQMTSSKKSREDEKKKTKKGKAEEKNKVRQSSIKNCMTKVHIDPLKKKVDGAVVKLMLVENQLLQLVEKHNFRELLHTLEPGYICPSRHTLRKKIEDFSKENDC